MNVCKRMMALWDAECTVSDTCVVWEKCFVVIVPEFLIIIFQLVGLNISA